MTPRDAAPSVNPLLEQTSLPPRYDRITPADIEPAIRTLVAEANALRDRLVAASEAGETPTWDGFFMPLEEIRERIDHAWSAASNLDSTIGTPDIRKAHREAQTVLTEYRSAAAQDEAVYRACVAIAEGPGAGALSPVHRKILSDVLRTFRTAGVHLGGAAKARAREIRMELAQIGSTVAENVTDDALAFRLVIDDPSKVAGLPAPMVAAARRQALADDAAAPENRWSFTLDGAVVVPFLAQQPDRALRETMARAWGTRASSGPRDNSTHVLRILTLRKELAQILGFANYAEVSLVPKMAESPEQVRAFLLDLVDRALPAARRETESLRELARADGITTLERHDTAYYRDQLRRKLHGFSQEELRPYFPLPKVLEGLGAVLTRIYGVTLRDRTADGVHPTWHPDVRVLEVAESGAAIGHVLFDPCARPGKRAGAWVSGCVPRRRLGDGSVQRPVAHLVCNFPAAEPGRPALLSHDEVRTLFHEFGHALHHLLSTVDYSAVSGTHGVPWDGVEFPSQFHENWIWHPDVLALLSGHVDTGAALPTEIGEKLRLSRGFFAASDILRQTELALTDLELHTTFDPAKDDIRDVLDRVRARVAVVPAQPWDRMENSFLHIFYGGYAAGYYGYKWAEVLAADAFERFEQEGIFSAGTGRAFRDSVLANGGSVDYTELFVRFRGRKPDAAALLRQAGIG